MTAPCHDIRRIPCVVILFGPKAHGINNIVLSLGGLSVFNSVVWWKVKYTHLHLIINFK